MTTFLLAQIGGQLFGFAKECVAGVGVRNDAKVKPLEENGEKFLPLADGSRAIICDMQSFAGGGKTPLPSRKGNYLIINHQGGFIAMPMAGRGRIVMLDETASLPLPPAFTGKSRQLIPGALINCTDLILLVDLDVLSELSEGKVCQKS